MSNVLSKTFHTVSRVLPPALAQRVYRDFVSKPHISLKRIMDYELYRVALFHIMHGAMLKTTQEIQAWLNDPLTLDSFKAAVTKAVELGEASINVEAINRSDWILYVVSNPEVHHAIKDWQRGGTFETSKSYGLWPDRRPNYEAWWAWLFLLGL